MTPFNTFALRSCAAVALVSTLGACASVKGMLGQDSGFSGLDRNGDGVLSEQEVSDIPSLRDAFARIDTNGDRNINPDEFKAATTLLTPQDFDRLDLNGDGVVSAREAEASRPSLGAVFDAVDADGDGNVSSTEYRAATLNLLRNVEFSELDRDGDGVLSRDEADANPVLKSRFKAVDIDGDGLLGPDEYRWAQRQ